MLPLKISWLGYSVYFYFLKIDFLFRFTSNPEHKAEFLNTTKVCRISHTVNIPHQSSTFVIIRHSHIIITLDNSL